MAFDEYFDRRSGRFASLYRSRPVSRAIGRGAMFERLDFAVDKILELRAKHVLDVGCGSGPLFEPLAARGVRVTGIEPAPGMIELAEAAAADCDGLVEVVEMGWEGLRTWDDRPRFDVAVALGIFDYVPDAADLLSTMASVADHCIASFPRPGLRTNLRRLRYGARGVSVYGYSRERVESLAVEAGLRATELVPLGRAGYVLLASNPLGDDRGHETAQDPVVQP